MERERDPQNEIRPPDGPEEPPRPGPQSPDEDLVIENFARDMMLPREIGGEPPRPDSDLIIVRDLADQVELEPRAVPKRPSFPSEPRLEAKPEAGDALAASGPDSELGDDPPPVFEPHGAPPARPSRGSKPEAEAPTAVDWENELRPSKSFRRPPPDQTGGPAGAPARVRIAAAQEEPPPPEPVPVEPPPHRALRAASIAGAVIFAGATFLMTLHIEPFTTWYYLFAWYPFLLMVNYRTAKIAPDHSLFRRPVGPTLMLFFWSVPVWLFFEFWNFRLQNWYYVGVPADLVGRRFGVAASFATVLPAIFFLDEWLKARGVFAGLRTREFGLTRGLGEIFLASGVIWGLFLIVLPTAFFPLLWGVPVLLLEPWLWRGPGPSLIREWSEGRPERTLRLLAAGLGCGLFWESMNFFAGGKWIYTVPGFETSKLFEMPVVGFVGFAPFALSCWVMARALVRLGLLPEWEVATPKSPARDPVAPKLRMRARAAAVVATLILSAFILQSMDRLTIDSYVPRPDDIPNIPAGVAQYAREHGRSDVQGVLEMAEAGEFYIPGESSEAAIEDLAREARLVLLRSIGTENARRLDLVGVGSIEDLAARDPDQLVAALWELDEPGWWPRERRVAVWIEAARRSLR